jgi:ribonuclease T1
MTLFVTPRETTQRQAPTALSRVRQIGLGVLASAVLAVGWMPAAQAFVSRTEPAQTAQTRANGLPLSQLPLQGQEVYRRIRSGGPFQYSKDGVVFGNREAQLPRKRRGYYHEYTVPTPGSRDRGARRIVCGGEFVQSPETCFYTQDHYQSFQKIDPAR